MNIMNATKGQIGASRMSSRVISIAVLMGVTLASACVESAPPFSPGTTDPTSVDTYSQPPAEYENAPPDQVVDGVEIIDPHHQLAGSALHARALSATETNLADPLLAGAWEIFPSSSFQKPVYVRFPLSRPLAAGTSVVLLHLNEAVTPPEWQLQSLGRVLVDGRRALFAVLHFSKKAISEEDSRREAFLKGTACDGGVSSRLRSYVKHERSCARDGGTCDGREPTKTITARMDRLTATSYTGPLFHMKSDEVIAQNVVFKNEECADSACRNPKCPVEGCQEDEWASPAVYWPLRRLGTMIAERSCGTVGLRVTESFDSCEEHSTTARHYVGRAIDLTLTRIVNGVPEACVSGVGHLGLLAALAEEAGFDFVFYENELHVHVSVDPYYYYFGIPNVVALDGGTISRAQVGAIDSETAHLATPDAGVFLTAGESMNDPQGLACAEEQGLYVSRYERAPHKAYLSLLGSTQERRLTDLFNVTGSVNVFDSASIAQCGDILYFNTPRVVDADGQIVAQAQLRSIDTVTMREQHEETVDGLIQSIACANNQVAFSHVPRGPYRASVVQRSSSGSRAEAELFGATSGYVSAFAQAAIAQCGDKLYYSRPKVVDSMGVMLERAGLFEFDMGTMQRRLIIESDGEITAIACDGGRGAVFAEMQESPRQTFLRRWTGREQDIQSIRRIFNPAGGYINVFGSTPVVSCRYIGGFTEGTSR